MAECNSSYGAELRATLTPITCESSDTVKWRVESTPEVQEVYNKIRGETERAANQHLHPPAATRMSRSTTVESYTGRSPVHSPTDNLDNSNHGPTSQATGEPKRRGRRIGPLDPRSRIEIAFKRKLKLICEKHRAKKIACRCFVFDRLEANYPGHHESSERSGNRSRSTSRASTSVPTPSDGTSYSDLRETFGTGGAAPELSPRNDEPTELDSPLESTTAVRPSVQSILTFDINSIASVTAMTRASQGQPYYPGAATNLQFNLTQERGRLFPIGSEMPGYPHRWQCEFNPSTDTASEVSSEACSWTGPFSSLRFHFRNSHHPFEDAQFPHWSKCTRCTAIKSNWDGDTPVRCTADNCSSTSWQKWFYGSAIEDSDRESVPTYTQSGASEGGFSWSLDPPWGYPNSGGTEPSSGWYNSYSGSYYEHSTNGENKSEACDNNSLGWAYDSRPNMLYSLLRLHAKRRDSKRRAGHPGRRKPPCCVPLLSSAPSECRLVAGLFRYVKSPWRQFIPIVVPLMATIIHDGGDCIPAGAGAGKLTASSLTGGEPCIVRWWSLVMLILGFLATWVVKDAGSSGGGGSSSSSSSNSGARRWGGSDEVGRVGGDVDTRPLCTV
ncbi:hypothetical protein F5X99DRAFT_325979 [Biscogniauxia marginata]|nr:hypothetical protein F5X99DRAFT_325979 [Biscogniauxia marginata]